MSFHVAVVRAGTTKKMYKKAWCTCRVVVLLTKPNLVPRAPFPGFGGGGPAFWCCCCPCRRCFVRSLLSMQRTGDTKPWFVFYKFLMLRGFALCEVVQNSLGFWIIPVLDSRFVVSGTWIPDSLSWIPDSRAHDSGFHKRKIPHALIQITFHGAIWSRGGSWGRVWGVPTPPPPPILTCAFPISNTTGILHKKVFVPYLCWRKPWEEVDWNCMVNTVRMVVKMIVS